MIRNVCFKSVKYTWILGLEKCNFYELLIFYRGGAAEDSGDCSQPLMQLRMKSYRLLEEAIDVFLPEETYLDLQER